MINRAKMPRQLRNKGGITNVMPRKKYGIGSDFKDFVRKVIPNELADVAVKAAPFVAPFNPAVAGLMRGIGRFDQRGSLSDAFKQGLGTYAGGQLFRTVGGAGPQQGLGGFKLSSPLSEGRTTAIKNLFTPKETLGPTYDEAGLEVAKSAATTPTGKTPGIGSIEKLRQKIPIINKLDPIVGQQLIVGGATSAASLIYDSFVNNYREHDPETESYDEYLARRKEVVGRQMRQYFDNYFKFDKEYSALDDNGKDAFVARYNVKDGGRIKYQTGGITMANTLAENIRRNRAAQAAFNQMIRPAQIKASKITPSKITPIQPTLSKITPIQPTPSKITPIETRPIEIKELNLNRNPALNFFKPQQPQFLTPTKTQIQTGPQPGELDPLGLPMSMTMLPGDGLQSLAEIEAITKRIEAAQAAMKPTYEERLMGESWETLSDNDQYRIAMEYPGETPPRRNPDFVPGLAKGGMPVGIMRTNKAGVMERDYRDEGGFVPVGIKEKADDVPAMLSKNEFVMTANAVRGAGNGSIEKGAQKMYDTMKRLEKRVV